jgi:arylsulfatase A
MKPNIVLINCDDLGYGDLGCYGSDRNNTPHLDRLAAEGVRFTDFYMASPVCSASRAGMLTGCYPARIGFDQCMVLFPGQAEGLNPDEKTIASQLKDAGYATKIIGKWHCGDQPEFLPTEHGFDEYFGIPFSNDMGRQVGREDAPPLPLVRDKTVIQEQPDQRGLTERYTDEALQFIHANQDRPFFLYLPHMYVHVPLFVPQQFLDKSRNGAYGGAVEAIDWSTGVLMDALERLGLAENTLVVFTSDNGSRNRDEGGSNKPCRGTKGTTFEGGQRVPCIMRWPGKIKAGRVCNALTRSIDFFPTFSELAGVDVPEDHKIDGVDISSLMLDESAEAPNDTFAYYWNNDLAAIRVGDWKLHFKISGWGVDDLEERENGLYNLAEDVGESTNVYAEHPDVVERLEAAADRIRAELGDSLRGVEGTEKRPVGRVENAKPLTEYREDHPYMIAMYDMADSKVMAG